MLFYPIYHGTSWTEPKAFTRPSFKYSSYKGLFFTSSLETAQEYALNKIDLGIPVVFRGQLKLKTPKLLSHQEYNELMDLYVQGKMNAYYLQQKQRGHDGLVFPSSESGIEIVSFYVNRFTLLDYMTFNKIWKEG